MTERVADSNPAQTSTFLIGLIVSLDKLYWYSETLPYREFALDELEVFAKVCGFLENRLGLGNVGRAHVDLVRRSRNVKVQVECQKIISN